VSDLGELGFTGGPETFVEWLDDAVGMRFGDTAGFLRTVAGKAQTKRKQPRREESDPNSDSDESLPITTEAGCWIPCLHNSILLLRDPLVSKVGYDSFRQAIFVDGKLLSDELVISLTAKIESSKHRVWAQEHVRSALIELAHRNCYSSLAKWLDSLKWDGTSRIKTFFKTAYGCDDNPYSAEVGRVMFLSAVARAYQPGCQADVTPMLIGDQGIFKSTGLASLCPDPDWFTDDLGGDLFDRKIGEGLQGKWLIEFGELGRINRATLDVVKAFLTRRVDHYRPPYGRTPKDFPRQCAFIATTNEESPLSDTENRRFAPIKCAQGNPKWIQENRDQLWAEAVHLYKGGAKWWTTDPALIADCKARQEDAKHVDSWQEILQARSEAWESVTMQEASRALELRTDQLTRAVETRIGAALKAIGFTKTRPRVEGKRIHVWTRQPVQPDRPVQPAVQPQARLDQGASRFTTPVY
jgi:predicted P-loop ATPase